MGFLFNKTGRVKKTKIQHLNNFLIFILSIGLLSVALAFIEYEVAKIRKPWVSWIPTPTYYDLTITLLIALASILNIGMQAIIYLKGLENRRWLWWNIGLGLGLILALWIILGSRFLPILWPY